VVVVIAAEFLRTSRTTPFLADIESDPLRDEDALCEGGLLDFLFDPVRSRVGLLFDLRGALSFRRPTVGLLIARDVAEFAWRGDGRSGPYWQTIMQSRPSLGSNFGFSLGMLSGANLSIRCVSAEFLVGVMPGVGDTPPNLGRDSEETIRDGFPNWGKSFTPSGGTMV
jgi:hypothetical protein